MQHLFNAFPYNAFPYNAFPYNAFSYNAFSYNAFSYNAFSYNAFSYNAFSYNAFPDAVPMPVSPCMSLIAAGGLDWLEGLLPLAFVLFWIVSQVWGVFRNVGGNRPAEGRRGGPDVEPVRRPVVQEPRQPVRPGQPPPADAGRRGPQPPARQPRNDREAIARQIEEFLRDSTGGGPRQPVATAPRPASPPKAPARDRRRQTASEPPRPPTLRETPSSFHEIPHLAEPLSTREASTPSVAPPASPAVTTPTAADLAALFRDPATLRQLILVREVLDRPVGRW
jgi:hypothetical protein